MAIKAILTDIEGTVGSIRFVKEVLFPYADRQMEPFLAAHWDDPVVASAVADAARDSGEALDDPARAAALLRRWIAEDRKATPLKTLQGLIWRAGYRNGDYRAHVYPDAVARLRQWHDAGFTLYVYSSGSIAAQKLFFGHSEAGDLTPLFSGYFDTTSGGKKEAESYRAIQAGIGVAPEAILFLSDVEAELDAARAAGLRTTLLDRDDVIGDSDHPRVTTFDDIDPGAF
ncbi:acireductone synthase [Alloalcanivorax sp. C16-2]|uniref:acireductone synthase n=1 Tax=Alloalcanivorax TaxID=3020832 RepID=UPI001932B5F2|nr:acireductone synthase [Alloalcanivorax marinus]MBL7249871.1 acireductone synthase [Alloalcanivorax marinus]